MKDSSLHLPRLDNSSTRLCYREVEAATQRQNKTMKKLKCDKANAMCEIQALKLRVHGSEEYVREYRRQLNGMTYVVKNLKEKHCNQLRNIKASHSELTKQVTIMTRKNETQQEIISSLKLENDLLKRQLISARQKIEIVKNKTQPVFNWPQKTLKRSASRSSSTKDFPRT